MTKITEHKMEFYYWSNNQHKSGDYSTKTVLERKINCFIHFSLREKNEEEIPWSIVPFLVSAFLIFFLGTFWNGANSTTAGYSLPTN